ncbi:copper oxidase [Gimesia chilikensis]|uniref:multicopper oxidase domain-containing protein n=1 Tax=Gimesia chilikensis TaxID=2605989 RepID=UPI0011F048BB|nr:copper oxidase [Gimesia chilikensis]KAA0131571.1 copper oxidase [Gimesia chilikensis]
MSDSSSRRAFLKNGTMGTFAALSVGTPAAAALSKEQHDSPSAQASKKQADQHEVQDEYDGFSRYRPSRGHDPDSDYYIGKRVPGFRNPADGPAPFIANDLDKLPWKMKNGAKEFHLVCEPVAREFLPGHWMNVYGFNGSMPGPTIEVTQGDRIRIIVHNELPEETSIHWHGFELPVQYDGAHTMTQNPIKPGKTFKYEFDVHEEGTFFYHSHIAMQEAFGMVGWFIVHPQKVWDPPVDRDFGVIFQNFRIDPMQTVVNSWSMDWNWHTINGRSGPYATPLVCKHGERVRVRLLDFSPVQHHPIHMHGHTFWITGHEGARIPKSAWIPRNTELVGVAQAADFEFIANNPGDWMFHCHMVHHMMNHMVQHVGPRLREDAKVDHYLTSLDTRPRVKMHQDPQFGIPGYPQKMQGMTMTKPMMKKLWSRREVKGMRANAMMSMAGLMTSVRVLPDDLYQRVMETDEKVPKGSIFKEIVKRFGTIEDYEPAPPDVMQKMLNDD